VIKSPDAFRTISEVATELDVPQHVLRFWETKFSQIKPLKRAGGRRYYRPADIELIRGIQSLLYGDGYTIKGVQRILKDQGVRFVLDSGKTGGSGKKAPAETAIDLEAGKAELPISSPPVSPSMSQPAVQESLPGTLSAPGISASGLTDTQRVSVAKVLKNLVGLKARISEFREEQSGDHDMPLLAKMRQKD
jgi:DNA-binding transcriptional MerR regulator